MIAQHSSETNEHYTPEHIVTPSRNTLGAIDFDPASCELAQELIKARCWGSENGLHSGWHMGSQDGTIDPTKCRVFLNPPGGKLDRVTLLPLPRNENGVQGGPGLSAAAVWWAKLWHEWHNARAVHSAIFICFSMAVFRTAQEFAPEVPAPFHFPFCVPKDRINYDRAEAQEDIREHDLGPAGITREVVGRKLVRVPSRGAPADSAIVYLPPHWQDGLQAHDMGIARFGEQFQHLGRVRV